MHLLAACFFDDEKFLTIIGERVAEKERDDLKNKNI